MLTVSGNSKLYKIKNNEKVTCRVKEKNCRESNNITVQKFQNKQIKRSICKINKGKEIRR